MQLVLASASPRRLELLTDLGLRPIVRPSDVDETPRADESSLDLCVRLARSKARAATTAIADAALLLAADTVVCVDGQILGKPADAEENRAMMRMLANRVHQVHTGVCLRCEPEGRELAEAATTDVRFGALSEEEIAWYAASGEGLDKAGGYGIQGRASIFVREIRGSYANVVGLPTELVYRLALELGHPLLQLGD